MNTPTIFQAMFEEATIGILAVNSSGEIVKANPFVEKMFGYESGALTGQLLEILLPKSLRSAHTSHREEFNKRPGHRTMGANMELYGLHKNGEEFPVQISLSHMKSEKGQLAIAYIHDVTNDKLITKELQAAKEALQNINFELEEKVKVRTKALQEKELKLVRALTKEKELGELKSRFVSMASHEFRTPLSSILASSGLIARYSDTAQQEKRMKHINRIKSSVKNLTNILNDFLSLEKLESGIINFQKTEVNFVEFVDTLLDEMKLTSTENQTVRPQHSGYATALIDKHLVKNILINLLSNAIKYSPEGGNIDLISSIENDVLSIKVRDYGIGIPAQDQPHMFDRFFRATNVTNIQGTGLGLVIVKRYLDLMNGNIGFESKENEGTTFTVEIPQ